jgi:signal peptidase
MTITLTQPETSSTAGTGAGVEAGVEAGVGHEVEVEVGASGRVVGAVRFVVHVLAWMVIVALIGVLAATVGVPRVTGATPYTVLTGSMAPTYPPGTLVVDEQVDPAEIHLGDAVTFQIASGKPDVVTHRVVAVRPDVNGNLEFLTKGDANQVADPDWRPAESVRGRVWYAVPHLGRLNTLITGHQRQLAVYGVAGGLVLYAGAMFIGAATNRRRGPVDPAHRA